jgi:hypothetical protein
MLTKQPHDQKRIGMLHASSLALFVLRVFADDPDRSFSFDNLALFTDWFNR